MNLLKVLTMVLTSGAALKALSSKTGLSQKQLKMIITIALPLLIGKLTSNAASKSGATSLLGALGQHKDKKTIDKQIEDVDEEDGAKILGHIFGDEKEKAMASVAKSAGVSTNDVSKVLGSISPSILSGLSEATVTASKQKKSSGFDLSDGFDMTDVMGLFGGSSASQKDDGIGLSDVIGLFGNTAPATPQQSAGVDLSDGFDMKDVMGLLGGGGQKKSKTDGSDLLNSLLSFM